MKPILFLFILWPVPLLWSQTPRLMVPIGHTGNVYAVVFSPDGKFILTGGDITAKRWALNGRELQSFVGHTAAVKSVAFSPACPNDPSGGKLVLTGSSDHTAKLWDMTGREIQTFSGHTAGITSVAFSPDGEMVLTGSWDHTAKLWDMAGHEIHTFFGHADDVSSVAFSPNGGEVLTGSADGTAKLWNLNGGEIHTFSGHTAAVTSVVFSPDGKRVLTGSADSTAKLWHLNGDEIHTFSGHADEVNAVAFSPDGKYALTGSFDKTAKLWDMAGHEIHTFSGHIYPVASVAFSPPLPDDPIGGKRVLMGSWDGTASLWGRSGHLIQTFSGHAFQIFYVAFSPDGKYVLTGDFDQITKRWSLTGQEVQTFSGHPFSNESRAVSPDKTRELISTDNHTAELRDINGRTIRTFSGHTSAVSSVAFSPACPDDPVGGKMVLTGSHDKTAKLWDLDGREIQTFSGHTAAIKSAIFSPDGKRILTCSWDHTAKLWDLNGRAIHTFSSHTSPVSSVAFSPAGPNDLTGGKMVLTGSGDNTAKLWASKSGQELATLISIDSTDWVVTTPSGLFDASPGAMKLMHYVQGLDVIDLEQLKERYYEPGLLAKVMGFDKNELRNVDAFDQVALYPEIKAAITNHQLYIQLTERSGGQGKLSLFLNGKEVQEDLNPQRLKNLSIDLKNFAKYYPADTTITLALRAYNAEGWLKSQAYELTYKPATKPVGKTIPQLYAIVVGTANYAGDRLDLRFADLDAEAMAKAFQSTGSALFGTGHTSVQLLSTGAVAEMSSKNNIRQAFVHIAEKSTPADVLVVYFSGHGIAYGDAEKAQFYYLTKDIGSEDLSDPEVRSKYAISSDTLTRWLTDIPAKKQVMILDACNAGKVLETLAALDKKELDPSQIRAFDRMKDRTGMFILTGSAADQVSYEASQYGQGLLTYSLLQGMSGLALKENKYVDVSTLFQYSCDQVPLLAQGIGGVQKPILASPGGASFDIGIVQPGAISVAQKKPVFIRNMFQEETSFDDVLGLTDALEKYFREMTAQGAQAALIYVDVKEYENGYSMKGLYKVTGDVVAVRGRLFKGKESQGEFQVTGKKNDVPGAVATIVHKVSIMIK